MATNFTPAPPNFSPSNQGKPFSPAPVYVAPPRTITPGAPGFNLGGGGGSGNSGGGGGSSQVSSPPPAPMSSVKEENKQTKSEIVNVRDTKTGRDFKVEILKNNLYNRVYTDEGVVSVPKDRFTSGGTRSSTEKVAVASADVPGGVLYSTPVASAAGGGTLNQIGFDPAFASGIGGARGSYEATPKIEGFAENIYAGAYQGRREAELNLFKVGAGNKEVIAYGISGGALIGARIATNIVGIPKTISLLSTGRGREVIAGIPSMLSEYREEPLLFVTDVGFAKFSGKALGYADKRIGFSQSLVLEAQRSSPRSSGYVDPISTIKINPTVSQNAFLTKAEIVGSSSSDVFNTQVLRGEGRVITRVDGQRIPSKVSFELVSKSTEGGEASSFTKGLLETKGTATQGFTAFEKSVRFGERNSLSFTSAKSFDIAELKEGGLKFTQRGESAGGFNVEKISDVTFPESKVKGGFIEGIGLQKESFNVKGVVGSKAAGGNVFDIGAVSGGIEIDTRFLRENIGSFEGKSSVRTTTSSPKTQTLLESVAPFAKEQALGSVNLEQTIVRVPDFFDLDRNVGVTGASTLNINTPVFSAGAASAYDKQYDFSGQEFGALDLDFGTKGRARSGFDIVGNGFGTSSIDVLGSGRSSAAIDIFGGGSRADIFSGSRSETSNFLNVNANLFVGAREDTRARATTLQTLDLGLAQRDKLSFKFIQLQNFGVSDKGFGFGGFGGFGSPGGLLNLAGSDRRTPTGRGGKVTRSKKQETIFTPSLVAIEFDITGGNQAGDIFTGSELRTKPRRRK